MVVFLRKGLIMENTIYYFTGTGNSLKIAKDMGNKLKNTKVVSISRNISIVENLKPTGIVGFVFPVYYCGIPQIVDTFLNKINLSNTIYTFVIAVFAANGGNAGCINQAKNIFKRKQIKLNSAFYIRSVDNFIIWTWDVPSMKKQQYLHKAVDDRVKSVSEIIINKKEHFDKSLVEYIGPIIFQYKRFVKTVNNRDLRFNVGDKCNSCGLCAKVCPVKNIKMDTKPKWQGKCQFCLACLHMCPNKTINYGKATIKRQRYKNPFIKIEELYSE